MTTAPEVGLETEDPVEGGAASAAPVPQRSRFRLPVCLAAALALGAGVALALRVLYSNTLSVKTDVVGNPTFTNFNVRVYFVNYVLAVVVFPAVATVAYVVLTFVWDRVSGSAPAVRQRLLPAQTPPFATTSSPATSWPVAVARAGFVGLVLSAGVALTFDDSTRWLVRVALPSIVVYLGVLSLVSWLAERQFGVPRLAAVAGANTLGAASVLLVVVTASNSAQVTVLDSGAVEQHDWLPGLPAVAVVAAVVAGLALLLRRRPPTEWASLERWVLLLVTAPVALWLVTSDLSGGLGMFDLYHEGEMLTPARLVGQGAFPWKDVIFIHGLTGDVFGGWAATSLFGDTRWGADAGFAVVLHPALWIGNYYLCVYLFRRNWVLLLASQLVIVLGLFSQPYFRFVLQPVLLLLLAAVLLRATWPRAIGLMAVALVQFVATPEVSWYSLTAMGTVVLYELTHFERGTPLATAFARTWRCAVAGVVGVALWLGYLAYHGALTQFFDYYRTFVRDHDLTGGLPLQADDFNFRFWMFAPPVVILISWCYAVVRIRTRAWFTVQDWVVGASVVALIPYYTKFLARADGHVFHPAALTLVPLMYIVYRLVQTLDVRWPRWPRVSMALPLSLAVLVGVVAFAPWDINHIVRGVPTRWQAVAETDSPIETVGYENGSALDPATVRDLDRVLDAYVGDDGKVFDFTNSPALFGYVLDHKLATRYFHVSMAIREGNQLDLISELERDRPEIVVYESMATGQPRWDGIPNAVRHYLVSDYLLEEYVPIITVHGQTIMRRSDVPEIPLSDLDLEGEPETEDLYFETVACDWGYVPEYFALQPDADGQSRRVPARLGDPTLRVEGWAYDNARAAVVTEILAVVDGRVIDRAPLDTARPDVADAVGDPAATSGFAATLSLPSDTTEETPVRLFGVTVNGEVAELSATGADKAPLAVIDDGSSALQVRLNPILANVEVSEATFQRYVVELPPGADSYDWLEIEAAQPFAEDEVTVTDEVGGASHSIEFRTLPDGARTRTIMVGNCPQWAGYGSTLAINTLYGAEITGVRLLDGTD